MNKFDDSIKETKELLDSILKRELNLDPTLYGDLYPCKECGSNLIYLREYRDYGLYFFECDKCYNHSEAYRETYRAKKDWNKKNRGKND